MSQWNRLNTVREAAQGAGRREPVSANKIASFTGFIWWMVRKLLPFFPIRWRTPWPNYFRCKLSVRQIIAFLGKRTNPNQGFSGKFSVWGELAVPIRNQTARPRAPIIWRTIMFWSRWPRHEHNWVAMELISRNQKPTITIENAWNVARANVSRRPNDWKCLQTSELFKQVTLLIGVL